MLHKIYGDVIVNSVRYDAPFSRMMFKIGEVKISLAYSLPDDLFRVNIHYLLDGKQVVYPLPRNFHTKRAACKAANRFVQTL